MTTATAFVSENWSRLGLQDYGAPADLVPVMITPRFQASAHVVCLLLNKTTGQPVLVIKAARQSGGSGSALAREAANLRAVHATRDGGFDSIPRLLAFEEFGGTQLLLETALPGDVLTPAAVRRRPEAYAEALLTWVTRLHSTTARWTTGRDALSLQEWREPLDRLARDQAIPADDMELVERTQQVTDRWVASLPVVFEHGDLSAPNLIISPSGALGVVDWELANPRGIAGHDLFFSLAFVAFARAGATTQESAVRAFTTAFFGPRPWAWPYAERYAKGLGLDLDLLPALFVACWSRYVAGRIARLADVEGSALSRRDLWGKVRANRYFALWRESVRRLGEVPSRTSQPAVAVQATDATAVHQPA